MPTIPLLIDCDPGADDAFALALALASPEVEVLGVTTVAGNVELPRATANALALLELLGGAAELAPGADRALVRRSPGHPPIHGPHGLGGAKLAPARRVPSDVHAVELMASCLRAAAPRSVTIACLGPLTNLALLLAMRPDLAGRIDRLVVMGGSVGPGNVTPVAEFNVWADPEAAHRVLAESAVPVCLVALDVTREATLGEPELKRLGGSAAATLRRIARGYGDVTADGYRMHDALAMAAVVDPSLVRCASARIAVDTGTGLTRGQTVCAFDSPIEGWGGHTDGVTPQTIPDRVQVARDLDRDGFRRMVDERLG